MNPAVTLAWLRDLAIVGFALMGLVAMFVLSVTAFLVYRKVGPVLDKVHRIAGDVAGTTSVVADSVVKPVSKTVAVGRGLRSALGVLTGLSRRKGGKQDG